MIVILPCAKNYMEYLCVGFSYDTTCSMTVMVHFPDTAIELLTMMGPIGLALATLSAKGWDNLTIIYMVTVKAREITL